jgi:tetratricopeptide (TPR) repeat protein
MTLERGKLESVVEREKAGNALSGSVTGSVVQAGLIHQVVVRQQTQREALLVPRQLPPAVRDFVGRSDQMAALDSVLPLAEDASDAAAVTVVNGPPGVGKTTLAVRWAHRVQHRFPGGTLFVNLSGYGPSAPIAPQLVLTWFLPALGIAEADIPTELDAQAGMFRSVLAERRVLVVLDNASSLEQVRPLLPGSPGCMALVTSRANMTELVVVEAAHRVGLNLFTAAESHTLLRGILGPDRVDADSDAVVELLRVCDGLPLAVRVAATRVAARPQLDIADVVAEISEDLGKDHEESLDNTGDVGGAVRTVFDWSYAQLAPEHARVFRRLGLHPSPEFGVPAIAALTNRDPVAVYRCLEVLAELHLIEPAGRRRYRMHDLLHAYAAYRTKLDEAPMDRQESVQRGLAWYARTAQLADKAAFPVLPGMPRDVDTVGEDALFADRVQALAWLRVEYANLVAALRCAVESGLEELAMCLASSSRFMSYRERALSTLHIEVTSLGVTAAQASGNQTVEAVLLGMRGSTLEYLGRLDEADAMFTRLLVLADDLDDPFQQFLGLCGLGRVRFRSGQLEEAREYYQRALPPSLRVSGQRPEAVVHANLSQICTRLGEFEQALDYAERELVLRRRVGSQTGEAYALHDAALAWQGLGDHEKAIELCRQAVAAYRAQGEIGDDLVQVSLTLATSLEHAGDHPGAAVALREALAVLARLDDPRAESIRQQLEALESHIANDTWH